MCTFGKIASFPTWFGPGLRVLEDRRVMVVQTTFLLFYMVPF